MTTPERTTLIYDVVLKAPACALLQAAGDCWTGNFAFNLFNSRHWITRPTPGMRRIAGTREEWLMAAAITQARWGAGGPDD